MRCMRVVGCAAVVMAALSGGLAQSQQNQSDQEQAIPAAVPEFDPPQRDEHPRLFFRAAELPALREKAKTPGGQAIVKRLRFLLDGAEGTGLPSEFNPNRGRQSDGAGRFNETAPVGRAFTMTHAAGYGLLYQLTGERRYADLGRSCVERMLDGQRDRDNRYSFRAPVGALRSGPALGAMAMAYDLCFDGWDEDFRQQVAQAMLDYNEGRFMSLDELARGSRHRPGSNHWGPQIGGAALALLALRHDTGVDHERVEQLLEVNRKAIERQMREGWGDHGWFAEGDGPGVIASDTALVPAIQAWKVAGGQDFISPWPNVEWMTLKWVMLTLPPGGNAHYPKRGGYPHNVWARNGMSGTGAFAQGFGATTPQHHGALIWLYNHTFRDQDTAQGQPFDTAGPYPHRAVLALVNWPLEVAEQNPAEVLPHAVIDAYGGQAMFRNRWQDADDILVTTQLLTTRGNGTTRGGPVLVWGLGERLQFPVNMVGQPTHFSGDQHGGVVSVQGASLAVDFGQRFEVDATVVMAASRIRGAVRTGEQGKALTQAVTAGETTFVVLTLKQQGPHPELRIDGDRVLLGDVPLAYDGQQVRLGD